jgi:hypothetical protein
MSARFADASVTHERALKTCEPNCVPRTARHFFIPVVHNPVGVVGYMVALELSSRGGRAQSHGTYGSARAHLCSEARSGAEEHVAAPELSSWGGRARSHVTRGNAGAHLYKEARSGAKEHVVAPELNSARRRGPGPRDTWQHRSLPR